MALRRQNFQLQERVMQLEDEIQALRQPSSSLATVNLATFQSHMNNNNSQQQLSSNLTSGWWMSPPTATNTAAATSNDKADPFAGTGFFTQFITKRMMNGFAPISTANWKPE